MFERFVYVYGDSPIYSDSMLPYVSPTGDEYCCTPEGARKICSRPPHHCQDGRVNIKYIKAKMTLHKNLDITEMARLLQAQVNANGYAHRKGFNEIKGLLKMIQGTAKTLSRV